MLKDRSLLRAKAAIVAPYLILLPLFIGWIFELVAILGPHLYRDSKVAMLELGTKAGVTFDGPPSGALFGAFGSCYRINSPDWICSPSSTRPNYNQTLNALLQAGVPPVVVSVLPQELVTTPQVEIVALVFAFCAAVLWITAVVSCRIQRSMSFAASRWVFFAGAFCAFWTFLLELTAGLAQQDQFSQTAAYYTTLARLQIALETLPGFQKASLSTAFPLLWASAAFYGLSIPLAVVQYYMWPNDDAPGFGVSKV